MILPKHPAQQTAYMGLASIALIVFLTVAVTHTGTSGAAASGFGIPSNRCDKECQRTLGPDYQGIPVGSSGLGQNHCVCKNKGFAYREPDLWP